MLTRVSRTVMFMFFGAGGPATLAGYEVIDLGPASGWRSAEARSINDVGQIVGSYYPAGGNNGRGFLWEAGTWTDLGFAGTAWDINNHAQVVGTSGNYGYLWHKGNLTELRTTGYLDARIINDSGDIAGAAYIGSQIPSAFVLRNDVFTEIAAPHIYGAYASGANDVGQVAGTYSSDVSRAFIWQDGVRTDLVGVYGDAQMSRAVGINNLGQVVGDSWLKGAGSGTWHATLWNNGRAIDLGVNGQALAINDHGQVVGSSLAFGAFLFKDGVVTDLNTLLPPNSGWTGLVSAYDINESGWIVGTGIVNGQNHAFLLMPEPTTMSLLAIMGAFAFRRRP